MKGKYSGDVERAIQEAIDYGLLPDPLVKKAEQAQALRPIPFRIIILDPQCFSPTEVAQAQTAIGG
jgi:hypothetical protein